MSDNREIILDTPPPVKRQFLFEYVFGSFASFFANNPAYIDLQSLIEMLYRSGNEGMIMKDTWPAGKVVHFKIMIGGQDEAKVQKILHDVKVQIGDRRVLVCLTELALLLFHWQVGLTLSEIQARGLFVDGKLNRRSRALEWRADRQDPLPPKAALLAMVCPNFAAPTIEEFMNHAAHADQKHLIAWFMDSMNNERRHHEMHR